MATQKQQEEKRIKSLRRMVALPHNRSCFDCGQRGPTYVDMTIGAYVCTACSGILRGINPPHRVKSISMASFTQEEVDMLTQRGNEYNRHVWLGLLESKEPPQMDTKDEIKLREYITSKYEKKRWYVAPTDSLAETAKTMNNQVQTSTSGASTTRRPMGSIITNNNRMNSGIMQAPPASQQPVKPVTSNPLQSSQAAVTVAPPAAAVPTSDILADVFTRGAGAPAPATQQSNAFQTNFADFGSGNAAAAPKSFPAVSSAPATNTGFNAPAAAAMIGTPLLPAGQQGPGAVKQAAAPAQLAGDKYSSLTGLFSVEPAAPAAASENVNWNSISWGANTETDNEDMNKGAAAPSGGGWNTANLPQSTGPSLFPPAQQPASNSGWGNLHQAAPAPAPVSGVNPFLASSQPQQPAIFSAFGATPNQPPVAQAHTTLSTGFPYQPQQPPAHNQMNHMFAPQSTNQFAQQNPQQSNQFPQQNGSNHWQIPAQPANQWVPTSQWGGPSAQPATQWNMSQPTQKAPATSVNPFLMQQAAPVQQNSSTNPFL